MKTKINDIQVAKKDLVMPTVAHSFLDLSMDVGRPIGLGVRLGTNPLQLMKMTIFPILKTTHGRGEFLKKRLQVGVFHVANTMTYIVLINCCKT